MLSLKRRHTKVCPHREKGSGYTKCSCPIWVYGYLGTQFKWEAVGTRNWKAAEAEVERWMEKPSERERVEAQRIRIGDAIAKYLAKLALKQRAESTITSYRTTLYYLWDFAEGPADPKTESRPRTVYMGDLDLDFLDGFQLSRARFTPSLRSRHKEVAHLRLFFHFCLKRKWVNENYAKDLEAPEGDDMPTLPFEREEIYHLLAACDCIDAPNQKYIHFTRKRLRAAFLTLCYTGLRISDTASLERARLRANGELLLRQHKTQGWLTTKLHPDAIAALKAIPEHPDHKGVLSPYFFWSGKCKLSTLIGSLYRSMQSIGKRTGINVHPHRFRDTFAVELLENGEDLRTVQLLLGHKSIRTTEKHYAHFVKSTKKRLHEAVSKLDFSQKEATTGQVIPFPSKD
jgi:integrase/recombinase XerD